VFENRVMRKVFGLKRNKVTGEWKSLHKEDLNALYQSPNIIRVTKPSRMIWAGHVARVGDRRSAYRGLVGRPEESRPCGRSKA
jgi:hypothetical protein